MDELGLLGDTELVLTNHEDAIQGDCIEGTSMKPSTLPPSSFLNQTLSDHCHMRKFDDTDVKAEWLHPAAWFYRLEWEFRPNEMPLLKVCIPYLHSLWDLFTDPGGNRSGVSVWDGVNPNHFPNPVDTLPD
jgi:hypothetical protein